MIELETGTMTQEQLNLMLKAMPAEFSFVDKNDEVAYFSDTPDRVFKRAPAVIGRKVQNCHPKKSVDMVNKIVEAFKSGERDTAEFQIDLDGKFINIRYIAVHDEQGTYRGTLEFTQDVTGIRDLEGQRRLLDWD